VDQGGFAESGTWAEAVERADHGCALGPEEVIHVLKYLIPSTPTKVQIDIRSIPPLRVEEAFKGQAVAEGVGFGQP
jgi:hypothetical protein